MKKFTKWIGELFSYNLLLFIVSCIIYAIVCIFCFIFDTVWPFFGAVILNIVFITIMYLHYEKQAKKAENLSAQIVELSNEIKKINSGDLVELENETSILEIQELSNTLNTFVEKYNSRLISTMFINDMPLEFIVDPTFHIIEKNSFENQLPNILKETTNYRSLFCLVKLCGGKDRMILRELCLKIKNTFPTSMLAFYDDYTISVLVLNAAGNQEIEGSICYLVGNFSKVVASTIEDKHEVYYCRVGASVYPGVLSQDIIASAKEALDLEKDYFINFGENTISSQTKKDDHKAFLTNFITKINEKANAAVLPSDRLELIRQILLETAEFFRYTHADIFIVNQNNKDIDCTYDKYVNAPGKMFRDYYQRTKEEFNEFLPLFEKDHCAYFDNVIDLPPKMKEYFQKYEIQSAFQCLIKKEDNIIGFISMESDRGNVTLNAYERSSLMLILNILKTMVVSYYNEIIEKRCKTLVNALAGKSKQSFYMIDKNTYRLTFISDSIKDKKPEIQEGDFCYQAIKGEKAPCAHCPLKESIIEYHDKVENKDLVSSILTYYISPNIETAILVEEKQKDNTSTLQIDDMDPYISIQSISALKKKVSALLGKKSIGYIALLDIDSYTKQVELISQDEVNKALSILCDKLQANGYQDKIYRFNDSTLAFVLENCPRPEALAHIEKIFDISSQDIQLNEYELKWNYHCSLVMVPNDIRDINRFDRVINTAREESIALGLNCTYIYGEKGGRQSERKKYILDFIDEAIEKNKFEIYIQPIVGLADEKTPLYGEVLLRLKDPQRGFIPPNEFIPIANANNRMFGIEMSILNQVGDLWKTYGFTIFHHVGVERISINLSSSTLNNPDFVAKVTQICRKYKFAKQFLQFEINERILKENLDVIVGHMKDLKEYNISWALDNFGTGNSDLNDLLLLGFNQIKVDRSFILDIDTNERNKISVSFITNSVKSAGCSVVAEGVETLEQEKACKEIGFTAAQGYYFLKPASVNDYIKYLNFGK